MKAERLDSPDQVFYPRLDEFRRAEEDSSLDIRLLANSNRDYYAHFNPNDDPPIIIDSRGFAPKLPQQPRKENELSGTPVSSGIVIGPVKVLNHPDEKPILPGDVLVTKATDPGWTTLFINAAGVLLETGGMLQHGASVAREIGKPCIVGIEDVTKILKDGHYPSDDCLCSSFLLNTRPSQAQQRPAPQKTTLPMTLSCLRTSRMQMAYSR
jgi:rifampicin phosphotransferase